MDMAFNSNDDFAVISEMKNKFRGVCRFCRTSSQQTCKRCGDYYCSDKCQADDWAKHRYICFPKPPLVNPEDVQYADEKLYPKKPPGTLVNENSLLEEIRMLKKLILKNMQQNGDNNDSSGYNTKNSLLNDTSTDSSDGFMSASSHYPKNDLNGNFENSSILNIVSSSPPPSPHEAILNVSDSRITKSNNVANKSLTPENDKLISNDRIILCGFRSTNRCAIRPKTQKDNNLFRELLNKIDNWGRIAPILRQMPKIYSYAITTRNSEQFSRVKIINIQKENRIKVLFCDYGNFAFRRLCDLREITTEIQELTCYITIVQLLGVELYHYNSGNVCYMSSLENKEYRIKYHPDLNNFVQLFNVDTGALLNDDIVQVCTKFEKIWIKSPGIQQIQNSNLKKIKKSEQQDIQKEKTEQVKNIKENKHEIQLTKKESSFKAPFKKCIFPLNSKNIQAIIVDTSLVEQGYIACINRDNRSNFIKVHQHLNNISNVGSYDPEIGEYVVAQFQDIWCRGQVTGITKDKKYKILYNDFLNEATVTNAEIRQYPNDLDIDCLTTLCVINNLPKNLKPKQTEFLKNKLQASNYIFIDRVVKILDEKTVLIECFEIINEMYDKNLF